MSFLINNLANLLTASRIVFAALFFPVPPFSAVFWVLYCCCGVSDIADGFAARRLRQQSDLGAALDSMADAVFFIAAAIAFIKVIPIPIWLWLCAAFALLLRLASYGASIIKYGSIVCVHTYANKAAGALLFVSPLLFRLFGLNAAEIIVGAAAVLSAAEELAITLSSGEPKRDRKSIFHRELQKSI